MRPFQPGSAMSKTEAGKSETSSGLYANTRARPEIPTQEPSTARYLVGTRSKTSCGKATVSVCELTAPNAPAS